MHPYPATLLARMHAQSLLDEADQARLAARLPRGGRSAKPGSTPAWRRLIGSAVIDAGIWLAGGSVEPSGGCLDYGA